MPFTLSEIERLRTDAPGNRRGLLDFLRPVGRGLLDLNPLDQAAVATAPIPGIGDAVGLLADARMFIQEPESRTPTNAALSAVGALPFVPAVSSLTKAAKLGFRTDIPVFHGTARDFNKFDLSKGGDVNQGAIGKLGISVTPDPQVASEFASRAGKEGSNVVPLVFRSEKPAQIALDGTEKNLEIAATVSVAWDQGFDLGFSKVH